MGEDFSVEGVRGFVVAGGGLGVLTEGEIVLGLDGDEAGGGGFDGVSVDGEDEFFFGDLGEEGDLASDFFFCSEAGDLSVDAEVERGETVDEVEGVSVFFAALGEDNAVRLIGLDGGVDGEGSVVNFG